MPSTEAAGKAWLQQNPLACSSRMWNRAGPTVEGELVLSVLKVITLENPEEQGWVGLCRRTLGP